jgi:predicted esterase
MFSKGNSALLILLVIWCVGCSSPSPDPKLLFSIHYNPSMPRANIALIIPGLSESNSDSGYGSIGEYYKSEGITPVFVNIDWKSVGFRKLAVAATQIHTLVNDSFPNSRVYLFGFSFGAAIVLKLSQMVPAEQIILCSMSPVFVEDRVYQVFPLKQLMGLITNSSNGLSYSVCQRTCVFFLYGDHDSFVINKSIIHNRQSFFTCNETIMVENGRHDISGENYLKAIHHLIRRNGT